MDKIFDMRYAKWLARGYDLKVTLRKNKYKGVSLYATKPIRKNNVIAYYKFKVYSDKTHKQVKHGMYGMTVYTKKGNESRSKIGDVYPGSLREPKGHISYWAYFSNEPAREPIEQYQNSYLDINLNENYRNRSTVKEGDVMIYKLRALRDINPGEEITWCYGGSYGRDYIPNCKEI